MGYGIYLQYCVVSNWGNVWSMSFETSIWLLVGLYIYIYIYMNKFILTHALLHL